MTISAGLLMYRRRSSRVEVLLVHPGGPYFARKDAGSWTIPKGLVEDDEPDLEAARREFEEETSIAVQADRFIPLGEIRQKGGKVVRAWAFHGNCDPELVKSNLFETEWPPRSGSMQRFPEIDRAEWYVLDDARSKIIAEQRVFLDRLEEAV